MAPECSERFYIIFVNGVFNTRFDAEYSLSALSKKIEQIDFAKYGYSWKRENLILGYNPTFGLMDLFEAYLQKMDELKPRFWLFLENLQIAPVWFTDTYKMLSVATSAMTDIDHFGSTELQLMVNDIIIRLQGKVLLVAHSQGNFFANNTILSTRNSLLIHWRADQQKARLVSVASPATSVEGEGSYTTLTTDWIIRSIPTALKPNASNVNPKPGYFDHEFIKHYLNGDESGPKIVSQIEDEAKKLQVIGNLNINSTCSEWFNSNYSESMATGGCYDACYELPVSNITSSCRARCSKLCSCLADGS